MTPRELADFVADAIEVARASVPAHPPMLLPGEHLRFVFDSNIDRKRPGSSTRRPPP